jgi:mannonate dehydratase
LPPLKVKLGHELDPLDDKSLSYAARLGVEWVGAEPKPADPARVFITTDELKAARALVEKHHLHLEIISCALLNSSNIDREPHPAIMLAKSPERDRDIESFQNLIKSCAAAGVTTLKYNMSILGVVRSGKVPGRGDTVYNKWNYKEAVAANPPMTKAGAVSETEFWDRIEYFLARVVPVANEYKVRIACHPQDPGMPPEGYLGIHNVLGTIDGLKKFVGLHESAYHGLNFCQGTVSEMLKDPNTEIHDVIRYFGTRKKIFNVHFRNIHGGFGDFQETFPDVGSVNMIDAIRTYQEVGYPYMLMPDHVPIIPGDTGGAQAFAFAFGYIQALIQMLG